MGLERQIILLAALPQTPLERASRISGAHGMINPLQDLGGCVLHEPDHAVRNGA
jgi:hypothetical protein